MSLCFPIRAAKPTGTHEADVYRALGRELDDIIPVYYRRRLKNTARKAGNIADWVGRFGAGYQSFVILDGDSVMSGATLVSLALAMDADPKAGLIQTVPRIVGGETLLQRLQQFACNTYGPPVAAGLAFWHRDQGNYWGHNAIIRTAAFAAAAGLPDLPGRKPFGGHIMSHDFVEAVLLQRAGYGVHMMPSLEGSYEGMPPNIIDVVARDRRWAQGNLQHLAIVSQPGLTPDGPPPSRHGRDVVFNLGGLGHVAHRRRRAGVARPADDPELFPRCQDAISNLADHRSRCRSEALSRDIGGRIAAQGPRSNSRLEAGTG